ncbi:MAG: Gfo/Idh/MocA family protein, partial [Anaerolineae bacterium]
MNQTKKIRWGLLSTANINRRLIPAIRASQQGELTAVASRSQASADAYAAEWEIPRAFGSYEAMLASDAIDAVYISLPHHL